MSQAVMVTPSVDIETKARPLHAFYAHEGAEEFYAPHRKRHCGRVFKMQIDRILLTLLMSTCLMCHQGEAAQNRSDEVQGQIQSILEQVRAAPPDNGDYCC